MSANRDVNRDVKKDMNMGRARLEVLAIGPGASLQDRGRPGWQRYGVSEGGALDRFALAEGQALLGNAADCAALELDPVGGRFRAVDNLWLALTGPERRLVIGGRPRPWRAALPVVAGDEITVGADPAGRWCWLHLGGGIEGPVVLGARASLRRAGIGLLPKAGMVLEQMDQSWRPPAAPRRLALPLPAPPREIRVLPGAQTHLFPSERRTAFLEQEWRATAERDRQGMRIEGSGGPFEHPEGLHTLSDVILPGDIQITGDGKPAVLLADRQPTGGYPRIFTVIRADLDLVVHMPVGHRFRFRQVTIEEACAALMARRRQVTTLSAHFAPIVEDPHALPAEALLAQNLVSGATAGDDLPWELLE